MFLGGEAGVGKTTLVAGLTDAIASEIAVRRGGCDNVTTAAALGPIADAVPEVEDVLEADAGVDRLRLFRRLRAVLAGTPTMLILEDVHWADEATLDVLRLLGRRLDGLPTLVVATFREDELSRDHPLTVVLGDLATMPGVVRMQLPPLTVDGVRQLVEQAGSVLDPEEVHRNTGGNAFYVTEVLAAGDKQLPATVRDAVLARAHRLTEPAQRALAAAAVLGPRTEFTLLAAVSGEPVSAIDECVHRGVLVQDGDRLGFRHELGRLAIEQTLSPGRRAGLHAAALHTLRTSPSRDDRTLAHHAAGCADHAAVVEHAPRAAARAARLGAHREAAELYRLALRFTDPAAPERTALFEALSYECYLTDQVEEALAARAEAMRLAEQDGDLLAVGVAQRWLSRLSWFLGRNAESERWAADAVATLEPLGDSPELAMAYSNVAQLGMLAMDHAAAVEWGDRAVRLARRVGDREVEIHALNNMGAAMMISGDPIEGAQRLAQSLDMALTHEFPEHAARAYTNLGAIEVVNHRYADADRNLHAGIAYCTEHDLDSWRLYMRSWLARSHAEQGRSAAAAALADEILRRAHLSPITHIGAAVVAGQVAARQGRADADLLATALTLAKQTGEAQRLVPVAAGLAEAAWLAGDSTGIVTAIDHAWQAAIAHAHPWDLGELSWWLSVAGVRRAVPIGLARPFALMLDGAWRSAADEWQALGSPLWAAFALGLAPDLDDARHALELVEAMATPAIHAAILRDRHALGLAVPRGPRAASRANAWGLTAREIEILGLLADGLSNAELAKRLFLSEKTVGHHVSAILRKSGEPSRSRAVASARRQGIVTPT